MRWIVGTLAIVILAGACERGPSPDDYRAAAGENNTFDERPTPAPSPTPTTIPPTPSPTPVALVREYAMRHLAERLVEQAERYDCHRKLDPARIDLNAIFDPQALDLIYYHILTDDWNVLNEIVEDGMGLEWRDFLHIAFDCYGIPKSRDGG